MFGCIIAYNGGENLYSIGKKSIELYRSNGKILGKKESGNMDLKRELTDYEIGGIGDIKKHTLRFHSYRIGTESGKPVVYAIYEPEKPPEMFNTII